VHLKLGHRYEDFYGRMGADGRLTVPKVTAKGVLEVRERREFERVHSGGYVVSCCGGRGRGGIRVPNGDVHASSY